MALEDAKSFLKRAMAEKELREQIASGDALKIA